MIEVTFFLQEKILILYLIYKKEMTKKILKGNKLYNIYFLYYIYLS